MSVLALTPTTSSAMGAEFFSVTIGGSLSLPVLWAWSSTVASNVLVTGALFSLPLALPFGIFFAAGASSAFGSDSANARLARVVMGIMTGIRYRVSLG